MAANITKTMVGIVRAIQEDKWTTDIPQWAYWLSKPGDLQVQADQVTPLARAVQTAEAFILLGQSIDPTFNADTFIKACGFRR